MYGVRSLVHRQFIVVTLMMLSATMSVMFTTVTLLMKCDSLAESSLPGAFERSERLRQRVGQACKTFNISSPVTSSQLSTIFVDEGRRLLYCSVPKAASTSWKRMWLKLTGAVITENETWQLTRDAVHTHPHLWSLYHPRFEDTRTAMLASYRKIIIVRHPLERVISAYRDKLEGYTGRERLNFRKYMKERIEEKFGLSSPGDLVSFVDFVRFIVAQDDEELVQLDPHWRSIHQMCNPCAIEYDFIGKFERLREDSAYVLRWLGSEREMMLPQAMYPTSASNFTAHYLGLLHTDLKQAFLAKYLLDYISFDYALL